jgi:hypothetical protein
MRKGVSVPTSRCGRPRSARRVALASLACAAVLAVGTWSRAEDRQAKTGLPPLRPGTRVRVNAGAGGRRIAGPIRGTLVAMDGQAITLDVREGGAGPSRVQIPLGVVSKVEASRGRHGHPWTGAALGFTVGAALGFGLAQHSVGECNIIGPCPRQSPLPAALGLGLLGATAGVGIGTLVRSERWTAVDVLRVDVAVGPTRDRGLSVTARLSF